MRLDRETAIDSALSAGNFIYNSGDEGFFWALTLIAFNLFELVGKGDSARDRFLAGYEEILNHKRDRELTHEWHEGCVARAIRNLFAHGLQADRKQPKKFYSDDIASLASVAFISKSQRQDPPDLYHIELVDGECYEIRFSPPEIWYYVQQWQAHRRTA